MTNLIHCPLCLESFGAFGAWVCLVLTLFMLFELVNIDPSYQLTHTRFEVLRKWQISRNIQGSESCVSFHHAGHGLRFRHRLET